MESWAEKLKCNLELQPRMRVVASSAHISAEQNELPGSLFGVGTTIDPTLK
jgi:translation initiation factor 2 gamma subunit (eIF-2gamma)